MGRCATTRVLRSVYVTVAYNIKVVYTNLYCGAHFLEVEMFSGALGRMCAQRDAGPDVTGIVT